MVEAANENFAVADMPCLGRCRDGLNDRFHLLARAGDFDFDLGQKAHGVLGAAIKLGVALLPPVALYLTNGQSLNADLGEGIADLVQLEWFDDGCDDFHMSSRRGATHFAP